jgi:hypothetical protein
MKYPTWRIHEVDKEFLILPHIEESDGAGLHGDAALLLILPAVHVAEFAGQAARDNPVGRHQAVGQARLPVVHVRQDANVAYIPHAGLQSLQLLVEKRRHFRVFRLDNREKRVLARKLEALVGKSYGKKPSCSC